MEGLTEIGPCDICEDKGWIMIEKAHYKDIVFKDGTKKRSLVGVYNTVYNCACDNEHIRQAKELPRGGN